MIENLGRLVLILGFIALVLEVLGIPAAALVAPLAIGIGGTIVEAPRLYHYLHPKLTREE